MYQKQKDRDESLFNIVKTIVNEKITGGYLKPYERIPSELEWASLLGISRQTIRRALDELVHTGVLYRIPRKGTYVSPPLSVLNRVSGQTIINTISENHEYITLFMGLIKPPEFVVDFLGLKDGEEAFLTKQLIKVRKNNRYIQESYLPAEAGTKIADLDGKGIPILEMMMKQCGLKPFSTLEKLTLAAAEREALDILEIKKGSTVPNMLGVILSPEEKPIEAHRVIFNPQYFKLEFSFTFK